MEKKFDLLDRMIAFAGDIILMVEKEPRDLTGKYLFDQIMRSSGSVALNFGESQGSLTDKDYIYKLSLSIKELRETEVNIRILKHVNYGGKERDRLHNESIELIKILITIIKNRKKQIKG